jgi:hypothetical protein
MGRSVASYPDAVVMPFPNPEDAKLVRVHKKGFAGFVKSLSGDELEEWLKLYPAWYIRGYRQFIVLYNPDEKKVRVVVPKRRSHRADYYSWIKHLPLPKGGYWYLLTLTLYRSIGVENAWRSINRWVSKFMNRFRSYLNTVYGKDLSYLWVVEVHEDGFPHVHILFRMPYVDPKLTFNRLIDFFHSWWVDDDGNPLCARHGVDLKLVRGGVNEVRAYVLKYLVKNHAKYWRVEVYPDGRVAYRRSSALMWLFRVRLFGMSQDIRGSLREKEKNREKGRSKWVWYGTTPSSLVYRLFYKPLGIAWELWIYHLPNKCYMEFPDRHLPELVPSAFSSRGSPADDDYDDLIDNF